MKYKGNKAVVDEPSIWRISNNSVTVLKAGGTESFSYEGDFIMQVGDIQAYAPIDIEPEDVPDITPVTPTPNPGGEDNPGGGGESGGESGGETPGGGDNPDTPVNPNIPSGSGITFIIRNNLGVEARFTGDIVLNIAKDSSTDWDNSTQVKAVMLLPNGSNYDYKRNNIIISNGGTHTWKTQIQTYLPGSPDHTTATNGSWYFMSTQDTPTATSGYVHSAYLYSRYFSKSKYGTADGPYHQSNHMYVAYPPVSNEHGYKIVDGGTYELELCWKNNTAFLADDTTTENYILQSSYSYAILPYNKTSLQS